MSSGPTPCATYCMPIPQQAPGGVGALNPAAVAFYRSLLAGMRERGIRPLVTLYHWDLPQVLEDAGGWPARATTERDNGCRRANLDINGQPSRLDASARQARGVRRDSNRVHVAEGIARPRAAARHLEPRAELAGPAVPAPVINCVRGRTAHRRNASQRGLRPTQPRPPNAPPPRVREGPRTSTAGSEYQRIRDESNSAQHLSRTALEVNSCAWNS